MTHTITMPARLIEKKSHAYRFQGTAQYRDRPVGDLYIEFWAMGGDPPANCEVTITWKDDRKDDDGPPQDAESF